MRLRRTAALRRAISSKINVGSGHGLLVVSIADAYFRLVARYELEAGCREEVVTLPYGSGNVVGRFSTAVLLDLRLRRRRGWSTLFRNLAAGMRAAHRGRRFHGVVAFSFDHVG